MPKSLPTVVRCLSGLPASSQPDTLTPRLTGSWISLPRTQMPTRNKVKTSEWRCCDGDLGFYSEENRRRCGRRRATHPCECTIDCNLRAWFAEGKEGVRNGTELGRERKGPHSIATVGLLARPSSRPTCTALAFRLVWLSMLLMIICTSYFNLDVGQIWV